MRKDRDISPERAERLIKKRLAFETSKAINSNIKMLNELDLGFGEDHINLNRRTRKK